MLYCSVTVCGSNWRTRSTTLVSRSIPRCICSGVSRASCFGGGEGGAIEYLTYDKGHYHTLVPMPLLEVRKATLRSMLAKAGLGLRFNEHLEGDGPTIFARACKLGLEGIVSKRKDSAYRSGRSPDWLK